MRFKTFVFLVILSILGGLGGAWLSLRGTVTVPKINFQFSEQSAVRTQLSEYLHAWQSGNPDQMYKYISVAEQQAQPKEQYVKEFQDSPVSPLKFVIKDINIAGDKAMVKVAIYWPNLELDSASEHPENFTLEKQTGVWRIIEGESLK